MPWGGKEGSERRGREGRLTEKVAEGEEETEMRGEWESKEREGKYRGEEKDVEKEG